LAGYATVLLRAKKQSRRHDVRDIWQPAEQRSLLHKIKLGWRQHGSRHLGVENSRKNAIDQVSVFSEIGGRGQNEALKRGFRDTV
jgi:hypothetical protein